MAESERTYSISLTLRRTTYEEAFVSVPVTDAIMIQGQDGTGRIDVDAMVREGVKLGLAPSTTWRVEEPPRIEPHPIQKPPPDVDMRKAWSVVPS